MADAETQEERSFYYDAEAEGHEGRMVLQMSSVEDVRAYLDGWFEIECYEDDDSRIGQVFESKAHILKIDSDTDEPVERIPHALYCVREQTQDELDAELLRWWRGQQGVCR